MRQPALIKEFATAGSKTGQQPMRSRANFKRTRQRWTVVLLASLIAIAIMAAVGLSLSAASVLHLITSGGSLSSIGIGMIALEFPLLIFAAHCLDRIDDAEHVIKMAEYKQKLYVVTGSDRSRIEPNE